jgi:hypothetical protein
MGFGPLVLATRFGNPMPDPEVVLPKTLGAGASITGWDFAGSGGLEPLFIEIGCEAGCSSVSPLLSTAGLLAVADAGFIPLGAFFAVAPFSKGGSPPALLNAASAVAAEELGWDAGEAVKGFEEVVRDEDGVDAGCGLLVCKVSGDTELLGAAC